MERKIEKLLKRYSKRKVKITLAVVVAFLLSCTSIMADEALIYVVADENGDILINEKVFDEDTHEYKGNTFENNIYTNNSIMKSENSDDNIYGIFNTNAYYVSSNFGVINNGSVIINNSSQKAYGIYNDFYNQVDNFTSIKNNGTINIEGEYGTGIFSEAILSNTKLEISNIFNNGIIMGKGIINGAGISVSANGGKIDLGNIKNNGLIIGESSYDSYGLDLSGEKLSMKDLNNEGIIGGIGKTGAYGINNSQSAIFDIKNNGIIFSFVEKSQISSNITNVPQSIYGINLISKNFQNILLNNGIISSANYGMFSDNQEGVGTSVSVSSLENNIFNNGIIYGYGTRKSRPASWSGDNIIGGYGVYFSSGISSLSNTGIIYGRTSAVLKNDDIKENISFNNYGLAVNKKMELDGENTKVIDNIDSYNNYGIMFTAMNDGTYKIDETNKKSEEGKILINIKAEETEGTEKIYQREMNIFNAEKIGSEETTTGTESFKLSSETDYSNSVLNGITDTLLVDGEKTITGSVINGYTNGVKFDEKGGSLTLAGSVINGGLNNIDDEHSSLGTAVSGSSGDDELILNSTDISYKNGEILTEGTIINGNIDLGAGSDKLVLDDKTQVNGIIDGGEDKDIDTLTFNSSKIYETLSNSETSTENNNINILHDIKNFESTEINTDVTLFETTVDENGEIKNLNAELGDITIEKNGNLILRIDSTNKNHALINNSGTIHSEGGKLLLALNGLGNGTIIDFRNNILDETMKGSSSEGVEFEEDVTLGTTSFLHGVEIGKDNKITITAEKDLPSINDTPDYPDKYDKLNKIYHSMVASGQDGEFTGVTKEKYSGFLNHLHDIYAENPYAYSSELSRKSMDMFKDTALSKDLKPELNNWAIFGGFTHIDGGTKESYYGKGYYTYDIGSKDVDADTKITGAYMQAEYGKSETLSTGILFGGNNAETELNTGKVEGDLFYFGVYAKKFINDFRFTLGAGFQHGDYKADRTALGYNGITETRKYSENYHDRGFNIYGDIKYSKEIIKDLFIEPYFNIEYFYIDQDGADERGVLALETDSKNFDYTTGKVGVDVKKIIPMEKTKHIFTAGISYENILSGADEEYITGRFKNGTDFDILIAEKNDDVFSINAKYELEFESGMMFELKGIYSFEHDDMEDEWTAGIGIGYRF